MLQLAFQQRFGQDGICSTRSGKEQVKFKIHIRNNMKKIIPVLISILFAYQGLAQEKKILFIMSAADTLVLTDGDKLRQTGVFLNEFYLAYKAVSEAGYSVDIATPNGIAATIDHESVDEKYWKNVLPLKEEAISFAETDSAFSHPMPLEKAIKNRHQYAGMVIPGGQG